jgi:hypothetical protein
MHSHVYVVDPSKTVTISYLLIFFKVYKTNVAQLSLTFCIALRRKFPPPPSKFSDILLHLAFKLLHRILMKHVQMSLCNDPKDSRFILQLSPCYYVYEAEGNFPLPAPVWFLQKLMQLNCKLAN